MPFVRISLHKGMDSTIQNQISLSIHQALVHQFFIPEDDYFQVIERLDKEQIKYPNEYLGISHSDNIIFIQIIAGSGRTEEQKKNLFAEIAERISSTTETKINDIIIVLIENGTYHNWSFGKGEIQKPPYASASEEY